MATMSAEELRVTVPFWKITQMARTLASQDADACPTNSRICWRHKEHLQPFLPAEMDECTECWLHWLVTGE